MKIPNRQKLQQTALNHSSDIEFKGFIFFLRKMYSKAIFFFDN